MRSDGSAAVCDVLYFVVLTIVWIHVIIITPLTSPLANCNTPLDRLTCYSLFPS